MGFSAAIFQSQSTQYLPPDLQAAVAEPEARRVDLNFAPVISRMDNVDPTANSFIVEDGLGRVPITQVVYPGGSIVQLVLERPLTGAAVVHGGYGVAPASVPMDAERFMPMLGFCQAPVSVSR